MIIEPNEDSDRLELEGKYLLVVSLDNIQLVKPENGQTFAEWEYKHLKKYGKSTGKFNLECGRASKTGPGVFVFMTNEGRKIFNHIHGNIQKLGSKKGKSEIVSEEKTSPQSNSVRNLPKKSHEAPAAIGKSAIPEYAIVDKSKKKKKRSSLMVYSSQDKDVATTTGVKAGVFRKLEENVYDTPILDSIKPKQVTAKQEPGYNVPVDDISGCSAPTFFNSAPTKTVTQQPPQEMDAPFDGEDPFGGYSIPSFDSTPSTQEPNKVKPSGKNPFLEDPRYDTPLVPDEPMQWQDSKLAQPTTKSETKVLLGDYDVPPEPDDELLAFSNNPFSNSSNTHTSPFKHQQDYSNDVTHMASYASNGGTTTTTALSFESDDEDDGAVVNPLLNVEDFGQYLETDGNNDMWADLVNLKFT